MNPSVRLHAAYHASPPVYDRAQDYANGYVNVLRSAAAGSQHVTIASVYTFTSGSESDIQKQVGELAASAYNIIGLVTFDDDLLAVLRIADQHGLLGSGYVWLIGDTVSTSSPSSTADPEFVGAAMHGMLQLEPVPYDHAGYGRLQQTFAGLSPADCSHGAFQVASSIFQQSGARAAGRAPVGVASAGCCGLTLRTRRSSALPCPTHSIQRRGLCI